MSVCISFSFVSANVSFTVRVLEILNAVCLTLNVGKALLAHMWYAHYILHFASVSSIQQAAASWQHVCVHKLKFILI